MSKIFLASLLALGSLSAFAVQTNKDCFCPTCPGHVKKCDDTKAKESRTNIKAQKFNIDTPKKQNNSAPAKSTEGTGA